MAGRPPNSGVSNKYAAAGLRALRPRGRNHPRPGALTAFATGLAGVALSFTLSRPHETNSAASSLRQVDEGLRDVTAHLFQWGYDDVARECRDVLGPAGYAYVQISPPQEHIRGDQWWVDYQPVSYQLKTKRGDEGSLRRMIQTCRAAGVGVIADAVINHMTGAANGGVGYAGTSYEHYRYPGLFSPDDFHHCGRNGNDQIKNYHDRWEVQNCELLGLADLATEKARVQHVVAAYLSRLVALGVAGFRVDAAKHMAARDVNGILAKVRTPRGEPWRGRVVQEIWYSGGEPIRPEEYLINGRVHVFQAAADVKRMFESDGIGYMVEPIHLGPQWGDGYLPSASSQVFVTNHDLERDGKALSPASPHYYLAQVFLLTWTYGEPDVLSGYNFTSFNQGPPTRSVQCGRYGWRCEHRHPYVRGAVAIRGAAGRAPLTMVHKAGKQRVSYSRGRRAFIAINNEPRTWTGAFATNLPGGRYCNVFLAPRERRLVAVPTDGVVQLTVPAYQAVGLYVGGAC